MLQGNLWLAKSRDTGTTIGPFASSADWRLFGGYRFDLRLKGIEFPFKRINLVLIGRALLCFGQHYRFGRMAKKGENTCIVFSNMAMFWQPNLSSWPIVKVPLKR